MVFSHDRRWITWIACGWATVVPNLAMAVDGYKEFTFGLTPAKVGNLCGVALEEITNAGWADAYGPECQVLAAGDFPFLERAREVNFVFTKKGLSTIAFILEPDEFVPVSKTLGQKYPGGTLHPSPEEFQKIAARFDSNQPNTTLKITFDNDSVVLLAGRDGEGTATFVLMYTNPEAIDQGISDKAKNDL